MASRSKTNTAELGSRIVPGAQPAYTPRIGAGSDNKGPCVVCRPPALPGRCAHACLRLPGTRSKEVATLDSKPRAVARWSKSVRVPARGPLLTPSAKFQGLSKHAWSLRQPRCLARSLSACERWDVPRQHAASGRASPTRSTCSSARAARSRSPVAPARSSPCRPSSSAHCAAPWTAGCATALTPPPAASRHLPPSLAASRRLTPSPSHAAGAAAARHARLGGHPARGHVVAGPDGAAGGRGRAPGPQS